MLGATDTLLVLTSQRLARIDIAGRGQRLRIVSVNSCPPPASGNLAASLAHAWQSGRPALPASEPAGGRSGGNRRVWVISQDLFTEVIRLPLETTLMLGSQELDHAIAIEAESYSGISAFTSKMQACKLVDMSTNCADDQAWWVVQASSADLDTMRSVLARLGGQFQGATHPAMLQLLARAEEIQEHTIAEALACWPVEGPGDTAIDLVQLERKLESLGQDFLAARRRLALTRCMLAVDATDPWARRATWWQTSLACLTVVACGTHYWLQSHQLAALQGQSLEQSQRLSQEKSLKQQLQTAESQIKTLRIQIADNTARRDQFERSRLVASQQPKPIIDLWVVLFDTLAAQSSDLWWIERWECNRQQITLHGWAASSEVAIELAQQLGQSLQGHAGQVELPTFTEQAGLIRFQLKVKLTKPDSHSAAIGPILIAPPGTLGSFAASSIRSHRCQAVENIKVRVHRLATVATQPGSTTPQPDSIMTVWSMS